MIHCNACHEDQRHFFLCRLEPHIVPPDTPMLPDGTYRLSQVPRAGNPNVALQVGIDFALPTSYPFFYWVPGLDDLASSPAEGLAEFIPIPYCNMLYHLQATNPGRRTSATAEWVRPCLALPTKIRGWWKWFHRTETQCVQPIELLDNAVLLFGEQQSLLHLLAPLHRELIQLYKEDTLGTTTFNGWIPSSIFYAIISRVTEATGSQITRGLSTNLYDPQPTQVAALQVWQVPLIQCFVYKRRNREFHMARLHPLLRDPAGVKNREGVYEVAERFFF